MLEIMAEIQDLYPHLSRLVIEDLDDPDEIRILSEERLQDLMDEADLNDDDVRITYEEDYEGYEDDEIPPKITWDGEDDDNGGGYLQ